MWALVESKKVTQVFTQPKGIKIGDNQYPSNIFSLWSADELKEIGIYEVVEDNTNLKDKNYYQNGDQSFSFAKDTVTASYATATARDLAQLKTEHKGVVNLECAGLLRDTDWYTIREADGGTAMPSNIKTHRTAIRTKANEMCSLIDGAKSVDALAALYVYDEEGNRPLGEFPTL